MPYNSGTGAYERRSTTVIDATPDGDTVAVAIDVKLDQGIDDYVVDLNHHNTNGNHYPATSTGSDSRFLKQSPAGVVSWTDGVVAADAALKDMSNVASGAILPAQIAGTAYVKTNILGTVSQSSGVPTGAIIEQGINANGKYVRFADGTQICWHNILSSSTQEVPWNYPSVFASSPRCLISPFTSSTSPQCPLVRNSTLSTTQAQIVVYDATTGAQLNGAGVAIYAIGNWF